MITSDFQTFKHSDIQTNYKHMKKNILIIISLALLSACAEYRYDDFITDFDYTAVYFPHQELTRTFVYGEFDNIKVAVQMGGRRENRQNEWVDYIIDPTIEVDSGLTLLPDQFYTLSDAGRFHLPPGELGGELVLNVTEDFFKRSDTTQFYIPFRLTATSVDTILEHKTTMILTLRAEAAKFGHYYHNGVTLVDSLNGGQRTIAYHQKEPVTNPVNNWELVSAAHDTLLTNGIADRKAGSVNFSFKIVVNSDNRVGIFPNQASFWQVSPDGESTYNPDKREFYLNYKFQDVQGNNFTVKDTLIFRNRILDGVNQWNF